MDNDIMLQIKCEFDNWSKESVQLYNTVNDNIVSQRMSKGKLFNILPYENESNGFRVGKEIKSNPKNNKDLVIYYFDNFDRIVLIEEFGTVEDPYRKYIFYYEDEIQIFSFDTINCLISIKYALKHNDQIRYAYNYAMYGASYDEYIYDANNKLRKVMTIEAVNTKDSFIREANFYYDEKGVINLIEQDNLNGYIQELYPKLGKWRKSLE